MEVLERSNLIQLPVCANELQTNEYSVVDRVVAISSQCFW
jgi:hypothetical protein